MAEAAVRQATYADLRGPRASRRRDHRRGAGDASAAATAARRLLQLACRESWIGHYHAAVAALVAGSSSPNLNCIGRPMVVPDSPAGAASGCRLNLDAYIETPRTGCARCFRRRRSASTAVASAASTGRPGSVTSGCSIRVPVCWKVSPSRTGAGCSSPRPARRDRRAAALRRRSIPPRRPLALRRSGRPGLSRDLMPCRSTS